MLISILHLVGLKRTRYSKCHKHHEQRSCKLFTVLGNFSLSWHFKINFVGKLKIIKVDLEKKKKTHLNNIWWQKGNIPAWLWKNLQETYNVHEMFVCVSVVPLLKTRLLASNIGIPLDFCFVLMFQCFFLFYF